MPASITRIKIMLVTKRFVLVVVVLEFVGEACWDVALRRPGMFTRGQTAILHQSDIPLPCLIEDEDDDEDADDSKSFPGIADLIQDSSTLI
jgi:hypothetical protein